MKVFLLSILVGCCYCNPTPTTLSDKEVTSADVTVTPSDDAQAEQNSGDASVFLSEPIDSATKLLIALDEHVRKYLPLDGISEETIVKEKDTSAEAAPSYGAGEVPETEIEQVARQNQQMTALIDQVTRLAANLETQITDLVSRRRYVTAAMLRQMLNYVRRVRFNLERLQNRLYAIQAAATSGQSQGQGSTGPVPNNAFFQSLRDRINRITEEVGALMSRIRGTFSPSPIVPSAVTSSG